MLKKLILTTLMITVLLTVFFAFTALTAEETWPLSVRVNDEEVVFPDAQPFVDENYRTQVPVRFVSEALESEVSWLAETSQVSIKKDDKHILLTIGKMEMSINGEIKTLDSAPLLKDSRTFVPIRFVSEALGATIDWEQATNTVYIDTANAGTIGDRIEIKDPMVNFGSGTVKNESGDVAVVEFGKNKVVKGSGAIFSENDDMVIIGIADGESSNFELAISQIEEYLVQIIDSDNVKKIVELAKKHHTPSENGYEEIIDCGNKKVNFSVSTTGFINILIFN